MIVIHHLAVDGVSWRVLLEDLEQAYEQYRKNGTIQLPQKSSSYLEWAQQLARYADSAVLRQELSYWQPWASNPQVPIARDFEGANTFGSIRAVTVRLGASLSEQLMRRTAEASAPNAHEMLVAALASACWRGKKQPNLLLDLEGHGREALFDDIDLSRTVGWLTSVYPIRLDLQEVERPHAFLQSIKQQLRAIPQNGVGFSVLRYLSSSPQIRAQMESLARSRLCFNNLGQFGNTLTGQSAFCYVDEPRGVEYDPDDLSYYDIMINALSDGRELWVMGASCGSHSNTARTCIGANDRAVG